MAAQSMQYMHPVWSVYDTFVFNFKNLEIKSYMYM